MSEKYCCECVYAPDSRLDKNSPCHLCTLKSNYVPAKGTSDYELSSLRTRVETLEAALKNIIAPRVTYGAHDKAFKEITDIARHALEGAK